MSEEVYLLDRNPELLDDPQFEQLSDVVLADGTRAILVGGNYLIPADAETVLIPDAGQYYEDGSQVFEVVGDEQKDVVYYDPAVEENFEQPFKRLKIENQIDLLGNDDIQNFIGLGQNHYVYLNNDLLQIVEPEGDANPVETEEEEPDDLSQITGRNLLTGQTVTLNEYLTNIKKRMSSDPPKRSENRLQKLVNKKLTIGRTSTGQKLVAKVIKVSKNEATIPVDNNESRTYAVKTLSQLMTIKSVRHKLQQKDLLVKVVEGHLRGSKFVKMDVSHLFGRMAVSGDAWTFNEKSADEASLGAATNLTISARLDDGKIVSTKVNINPDARVLRCSLCRRQFASVQALSAHVQRAHELEIAGAEDEALACALCDERFDGEDAMCAHLAAHGEPRAAPDGVALQCMTCSLIFADVDGWREHYVAAHSSVESPKGERGVKKMYVCSTCNRVFTRYSNLVRHSEIHKGTNAIYSCNICGCAYNYPSSLTRHIVQTHTVMV